MLSVRVDEPFVGSLHAGLSPLRLVAIQYMSASCARGAMSELPIPVDWLLAHATWSASLFFFVRIILMIPTRWDDVFAATSLLVWLNDYIEYVEARRDSVVRRSAYQVEDKALRERLVVVFQEHKCVDASECAACSRLVAGGWYATADRAVSSPEITAYCAEGLVQVASADKGQAGSRLVNDLLESAECTVTGYRGNGTPIFKARGLYRDAGCMIVPYMRGTTLGALVASFLEVHAALLSPSSVVQKGDVVFRHELVSGSVTLDLVTKARGVREYPNLAPVGKGSPPVVPGEPRSSFVGDSVAVGFLSDNLNHFNIDLQEGDEGRVEPSIFSEERWCKLGTYSEFLAYHERTSTE